MKSLFTILLSALSLVSFSQQLSKKQLEKFQKMEIALMPFANNFSNDSLSFEERVENIHAFIPRFVTALKEKNSYLYPFDSLFYISKIKAPDNAFKIYTWELKEPLGTHRYYGTIQMNSSELKMSPLFDFSDTMAYHTQEKLTPDNWYGCMYYNCVVNTNKAGKKYYTLFGLDKADFVSNRKIMEVMTFNDNNEIEFSAEPTQFYYDTLGNLIKSQNRLFLEYTDKAVLSLNYNLAKEKIVFDHVSPPSEEEKDAEFSYIPDGTYEGFEWVKNNWVWINRVYKYSIGEPDSPPMPAPQNDSPKKNVFGQ